MAVNKIPESQLPVRSVSDTDYVRIVGADGKSYRVPKTDFNGGGGGGTVDPSLSPTSTNPVQNKAIYSALSGLKGDLGDLSELDTTVKTDLVSAINEVAQGGGGGGSSPSPYTSNPASLGTASPGSSANYSRGDHVHPMPTASDVGALPDSTTIPSAATATPEDLGTAAVGSSAKYAKEDHVHNMPSASDIGAEPAVTEVTNSNTGAVTQALDSGKIYHFTGSLTSLTITLNAASGIAQYHFDFVSGSTAATLTLPNTVSLPDTLTVEANKRYEIDILNGYGVVQSWAVS